jgi:hypothetical protein
MRYELFWDFTQRIMVVWYRRFGTNYWSHLQFGSIGCSETSVRNCNYTLRKILRRAQFAFIHWRKSETTQGNIFNRRISLT